jgi:Flp pilus assembly protein TadB
MLDDRDRHVLEEVERELTSTDPLLARRMRRGTWRGWGTWRVVLAAAGVALAIALLTLGLVVQAVLVLMILSWPVTALRIRRRRQCPPTSGRP